MSSDVAKITLGSETLWERQDPNTTWIELPDNGTKGTDFVGMEIMKFDPQTGIAAFKGIRAVTIPSGEGIKKWRLALELPNGYSFASNNPATFTIGDSGAGGGHAVPMKYDGNKCYGQISNNYAANQGSQTWVLNNSYGGPGAANVLFSADIQFNVIKED
ncbi:hypothetical protein [Levilactobacillus angrenensis]|uniref:Phage tail protein n=1 Tax=Levilactobacillus angrenensis TaxID=2486020 RepID=A0ABW1UDB9_9LACO|nr:hypothetical protein [Levilactobacillus angrenensis]